MKVFVNLCDKIKYLGLLGLPSLFLDNHIFDFLWLFWLFGFVGIFYNFSVFLQSLQQLWGMIMIPLRYGSRLPDIKKYRCKVKYSLPFSGSWTVVNGGIKKVTSHSWSIPTQRYAYDFLILDEIGKSHEGDVGNPNHYYCYGKEILAPADGEVIEVGSGHPDSLISKNGQIDCSAHDLRGNHILIRHAEGEYSLMAHLQPDSIRVRKGDMVRRGQWIACCGNSGNSSEPHLHFQLQDGESFFNSAGLPIEFEEISAAPTPKYASFDPRPLTADDELEKKYITRGQRVWNERGRIN